MKHLIPSTVLLIAALTGSVGCAESDAAVTNEKPATLVKIEGSDLKRIILLERAAKRIDLQTEPLREANAPDVVAAIGPSPADRTALPYTALLYDKTGATFTYISPKPLEYLHQAVTVERIKAGVVVLSAGPPPGTAVVTRGGAQLFGVETGVGK